MEEVQAVAVVETEDGKVFKWDGLSSSRMGAPVKCDRFRPTAFQVDGTFSSVALEGSIGGDFEPIVLVSLPGVKKVDGDALLVRPVVDGGNATAYLLVRR
jgi:hypothetical protein